MKREKSELPGLKDLSAKQDLRENLARLEKTGFPENLHIPMQKKPAIPAQRKTLPSG